jgi:hypothetical protein
MKGVVDRGMINPLQVSSQRMQILNVQPFNVDPVKFLLMTRSIGSEFVTLHLLQSSGRGVVPDRLEETVMPKGP